MSDWLSQISPQVRQCGSARYEHDWIEPLRRIYDHQLVLFSEGDFIVEFETGQVAAPAGTCLVIPPVRRHVSRLLHPPGQRRWIHFDWQYVPTDKTRPLITFASQPFKPDLAVKGPLFIPEKLASRVDATAIDLHRQIEMAWIIGGDRSLLLARAVLLELLVHLFGPVESSTELRSVGRLLQDVRHSLDELAAVPMDAMPSLQQHLESFGCSYGHLCRLFHSTFGLSPLTYVNHLRIERAKRLLPHGDLEIAEVARQVGILNPAYFSRLFRKITGQSPSEFIQARIA